MAYASKTSKSSTKRWNRFDFDLKEKPISISVSSATIVERIGQTLIVDVDDPDFEITVTGFDEKRDLFVAPPRVIQIAEEA